MTIIGIDLGTTNSLLGVWKDGRSELIPNALGELMTPSVVGLDDSGEVLVGRSAQERLQSHPRLTVAAFKRYMGTDREFQLGEKKFRAEELSALVLRALKEDAEHFLQQNVTEAIITVPAYFNDTQRKATQVAGKLAGLKVERLLNEPTAAALAYGLHQKDSESQFLVFDLGGGTFDVSLLELFDGIMEVRASAGDNYLGGEDFVDCIMHSFWLQQEDVKSMQNNKAFVQLLRNQAERAKRELSQNKQAKIKLHWNNAEVLWEIDESQFEVISRRLLDRLSAPVERALRDARIKVRDLDELILVGGATRMPLVRKLVSKMFSRFPAANIDPDKVVAMGAAVQAGLKSRDAALQDVVMTDVSPYTLGIEVCRQLGQRQFVDGEYLPIIERNTVIPASREEEVWTIADNQTRVDLKIYQGESQLVKNNVFLGSLKIELPAAKAGEQSVVVRFSYDINGLLEVAATVVSTGETFSLVIEENPGTLSEQQIQQRLKQLAQLKIHPREQSENRLIVARAERMYEECLGELRVYIGEQLSLFRHLLDRQNPEDIKRAASDLSKALNEIEGSL